MMQCVVVGGGLIGMLSAYELHKLGAKVTLLERSETGRESSWAGGGIISPLYPWRYPDSVSQLARWSQTYYPQLAKELRLNTDVDPEYTRSGFLILDGHADEAENWAKKFEVELQIVKRSQIVEIEPNLGFFPEQALWMPAVAQIRNPRLTKSMRHRLEQLGIDIIEHCEVTGLDIRGDKVVSVLTEQGSIEGDCFVVASGAWTQRILQNAPHSPKIEPVRGQMILYRAEPTTVQRIVIHQERYVIPRRDGRVLVGSTLEECGFDKSITENAYDELDDVARRLIPSLAGFPVERHWAGLRPSSPKGVPYIGPHPQLKGLFINAGHYRNGVVLGPASSRLLAQQVFAQKTLFDPAPYQLNR